VIGMAGTGPAPNPSSRRQAGGQAHTWTSLPADGHSGEIPAWPFDHQSDRQAREWDRIWRTPQAAEWATRGWYVEVAMYVRWLEASEDPEASLTQQLKVSAELRQYSDLLFLTRASMLKNRVRIAADEVAEKRTERTPSKTSARRRLKVADGAVAGS
jgi:hypothetical protein